MKKIALMLGVLLAVLARPAMAQEGLMEGPEDCARLRR
jgi:hypothetical protein